MKDVNSISEKARKILRLPDLKDKVICFIPEWERHKFDMSNTEITEKEYLLNEKFIFYVARDILLGKGIFSFLVFREFKNQDDKPTKQEIEELEKELPWLKDFGDKTYSFSKASKELKRKIKNIRNLKIKSREEKEYYKLTYRQEELVNGNIFILPRTSDNKIFLSSRKISEQKSLIILCIDYRKFSPYSVLYNFIRYSESYLNKKNIKIRAKLSPLYNIFPEASLSVQSFGFAKLEEFINKIVNKSITPKEMDQIKNISTNHIQHINVPSFWESVKEKEYLCEYNKNGTVFNKNTKKDDFRFFYSLESLLFWELKNCLIKVKRCQNCNSILPDGFVGKYCPEKSKTFKKCEKIRNRVRQRKYYYKAKKKNLKKT